MVSSKPDRTAQRADRTAQRTDRTAQRTDLDRAVALALKEDLGEHDVDVTTKTVIDPELMGQAVIVARKPGVLSGNDAAARVFEMIRPSCDYVALVPDGERLAAGDQVAQITGSLGSILIGERTALNFLQRMSGIATLTRRYTDALSQFPNVALLDTRKTTPGLRFLERAAVRAGGGTNHRDGLWDAILIKDNHVAAAGGVAEAVRRARKAAMPVEVEVETLEQLGEALDGGADIVLLDNMPAELMRQAVEITAGRAKLEASGGMTLEGAVAAARAGVDRISVGALTHSAPALDLSLEVTRTWR